jgi:hypothetical protein
MGMRFKGTIRVLSVLCILLIFIGMIPQTSMVSGSPPTLIKLNVTPRKGRPDIEYLFTTTYIDYDDDPPVSVKVFIDSEGFEMEEVDPQDTNYTDGKDFSFRKILSEGTYTFYYTANDGNSNEVSTAAFTLEVTWDAGHYDIIHYFESEVFPGVIMILGLFIVLIIIMVVFSIAIVLQLRKIGKVLEGREKEGEENKKDVT